MPKLTAIIPMKEHNARVPGKNVKMLGGKPLFHHMVDMLHDTTVDRIVLDLNGMSLLEAALEGIEEKGWPKVDISLRPTAMSGDGVGGNELLSRFQWEWADDELIAQMHVTSPFLRRETVNFAFNRLMSDRNKDSLFSVTEIVQRVWTAPKMADAYTAVNFDPAGPIVRTQDLLPCMAENGAFFMFRGRYFKQNQRRNGPDSRICPLSFPETVDIDTEDDFRLAELVLEDMRRAREDSEAAG